MKKLTILTKKCVLNFGQYQNNTIAITAYYRNQPFTTCTINWEQNWQGVNKYNKAFKFPYLVIDGRNTNEGICFDLVAAGVIKVGAYLAGTGGKVYACMLTDKYQTICKKQLNIK